ncbi:MAG: nucleotidyl transferase AbiEii/AbiGii toxin family protein [Bacteroidetes bacterium]|nr:nucleotidyl transferase AbiEii/AbiGii toxin family protein [Bacteroidota bacterium]
MLRREAVRPELFRLLIDIFDSDYFPDFFLVGGTALALKLGHRESIDIDLFTDKEIHPEQILEKMADFGELTLIGMNPGGLNVLIDGIKIDFVRHPYTILEPIEKHNSVRMLSNIDIAAQKLHAIVRRGSKKDFIDLYYLLNLFSVKELISAYGKKYNHTLYESFVLKSMTYFDDADEQTMPKIFDGTTWQEIKQGISQKCNKQSNSGF